MNTHNTVLVTGGAGYIGSHTCVELLNAGYQVLVLDNFCNSHPEALARIERITGQRVAWVEGDVRDQALVERLLSEHPCRAVLHFAGLKAVGESVQQPLRYYDYNLIGTQRLLSAMQAVGVTTLVFSSSATVYGDPQYLPYDEAHPLAPTNPYGRTKWMVEELLRDVHHSAPEQWRVAVLRYFNPVGAHPSGLIGEDPQGVPNNLMPFVAQVAVGRRAQLNIWGHDYPTPDGTGVRDYIHVVDLALGHVRALEALQQRPYLCVNLGTGRGHSVLEVVQAFAEASGRAVPYVFAERRAGDLASYYADPSTAEQQLGWRATRDLSSMCADHWRWQQQNPNGYQPATTNAVPDNQ